MTPDSREGEMSENEAVFVWSGNPEIYFSDEYPTREEALEAARRDYPDRVVWTGRMRRVNAEDVVPDGDWLLDSMRERAWDEIGEVVDDWPHVSKEAQEDLTDRLAAVVKEWAKEWGAEPTFFSVVDAQEHDPSP